ncbi:MAG: leucyl/phenylalanyl-tRNA--protein transferase, partial [Verrucomicrobia bacterium]|nr:leucyl/phenylalanyl-tRNA--protein transferase [Verrucomicrobiota bacterium]
LRAYRLGIFPMADSDQKLGWYSPDPRGILPLDAFHIPHGLRRTLKKGGFEVRVNTAFEAVMDGCSNREETWINSCIKSSYLNLFHLGHAFSVETWMGGKLAGGLYGVALGGAFFGESMFHTVTDASKIALHALVERLNLRGFALLDMQWVTPHLQTFGAREISRGTYLQMLKDALPLPCVFAP